MKKDKILRAEEVMSLVGKSRTTIWRDEKEGTFPKHRMIGKGAVGWLESEIQEWIKSTATWDSCEPKGSWKRN